MRGLLKRIAVAGLLLAPICGGGAQAENSGGILRIYHRDSPASMSIHEAGTNGPTPSRSVFLLYQKGRAFRIFPA